MPMGLQIDPMSEDDWQEVRAIYREGIRTGHDTSEEDVSEWEPWYSRHLPSCSLVHGRARACWAALPQFQPARCTGGWQRLVLTCVEATTGGRWHRIDQRTDRLFRNADTWTLQAGVFPESRGSLSPFERDGFRPDGGTSW